MALSDPFSTTYQGSFEAGQSLGKGIESAASSFSSAIEKQNQQKKFLEMIGMMKDSGAVSTDVQPLSTDEYIKQAEKTISGLGGQLGAKNLLVTGAKDPEERKKQYQAILQPLGLDPKPIAKPKLDANRLSEKYDISLDSDGKMTWKTKSVDPIAQEMKEQRLEMSKQSMADRESSHLESEWDKVDKIVNPNIATNRSPLGMAGRANMSADRALTTLKQPDVTNQEAGNVMADVASIYQSGSPTEFGMSEQGYRTLYAQAQALRQYVTGNPQDAMTPQIKKRLMGVLKGMKDTNTKVIKQNLKYLEAAKGDLIKKDPEKWKNMKDALLTDFGDDSNDATSTLKAAGMGGNKKGYADYMSTIGGQ